MMNFKLLAEGVERGLNAINCYPACKSHFNVVYSYRNNVLHIFNTRFNDSGLTEQDHVELPLQQFEDKIVCTVGKRVAFRYYGRPIYYPSEHAIFDLHIPAGMHFVFHGKICISTGTIRAIDERDVREILSEDHSDFFNKDLIQDMEHPTDLYVVDKV